jgi:hypothetical protein
VEDLAGDVTAFRVGQQADHGGDLVGIPLRRNGNLPANSRFVRPIGTARAPLRHRGAR